MMHSFFNFVSAREAEGAGSPHHPELIAAFNAVQITGLVLLLAVILTAWLSPAVKRSIAWYNIIISWIFSAFSFLLIMGKQSGAQPPFGLCLFQSMLIYAAPSMNACVCLCFALELFFSVTSAANRQSISWKWRLFDNQVIFLPYIVPSLVMVEVLALGLTRRDTVQRTLDGMYCHLTISTPALITGGVVVFVMVAVLPVVGVTTYMFIRNWNAFRQLRTRQTGGVPLRMVIRFGVFCLLPLPIVTISLVSVNFRDGGKNSAQITVAIATLPIFAALIFGTQADILSAWKFWKRVPKRRQGNVIQLAPIKTREEDIELDVKAHVTSVV